VRDGLTEGAICGHSHAMTPECFDRLRADMIAHASGMDLFAQDLDAGADPRHRLKTRVYTEYAWHSLFIRNLLIRRQGRRSTVSSRSLRFLDLPSFQPSRNARVPFATVIAVDSAARSC